MAHFQAFQPTDSFIFNFKYQISEFTVQNPPLCLSRKHTWLPQEFCSVATFQAASTSSSSESHRSLSLLSLSVYIYLGFIIIFHSFLSSLFFFFSHQVNKAAGPFDALICVGQFFPDSPEQLGELTDYIEGRSQVPLPTYFIGDYGIGAAKHLLSASKDSANLGFKMDGLKVCQNLFWLKGSGKFNLHGTLHIFFNVYFCNYYYSHFSRLLQLLKYFNAHCTRIYLQCKQTVE